MGKIVRLPLEELTDEHGRSYRRAERVDVAGVQSCLRAGDPRLVLAVLDEPLRWLRPGDAFDLWKSELRNRLAEHDPFYLEDFPGERAYVAHQWVADDGTAVIVFEQHH